MKFLKKLAFTHTVIPETIAGDYSPRFFDIRSNFHQTWQNTKKIANLLSNYSLIRDIISLSNQMLNKSDRGISSLFKLTPRRKIHMMDWAPLIKTGVAVRSIQPITDNTVDVTTNKLAGRSVLCVGGRRKLYPAYDQSVKISGGNLITFHGNPTDHPDNLFQLLKIADMIICPVDCTNHEAFISVKQYCLRCKKPCVLLDRSGIDSFRIGIDTLANMIKNK